jgi:hypothetical protein
MIYTQYFTDLEDAYARLGEQFSRLHSGEYSKFLDHKLEELCRHGGLRPEALEVGEGECVLWVRLHDGRQAKFQGGALWVDDWYDDTPPPHMLARFFNHYTDPLVWKKPFPMEYAGKYDARKLKQAKDQVA